MASAPEPILVTAPRADLGAAVLAARERDVVDMTAEERRWGRRQVTTRGGRKLALALPTGRLEFRRVLFRSTSDWYVIVGAAPEPVLALTPASRDAAVRVAFEVGNRHFPLAIDGDRLLVPDDPAMVQLLRRLGLPFTATRAVFEPLGGGHRHDRESGGAGHAH